MKQQQYWMFGLILTLALALGLVLIPRQTELPLIYMKGQKYDLAKREFEKLAARGDLTVAVSAPLTQLYLYFGEIDQAVSLMKRFVKKYPKDTEALKMLAKLYQDNLMMDDYLAALDAVSAREPTENHLRELAQEYEKKSNPQKQLKTLETLLNSYPGKAADFVTLAQLQANAGEYEKAVKTLETLEVHHSRSVSMDTEDLHLSLLIDLERDEDAVTRATKWLTHKFDPLALRRFVQLLRFKGKDLLGLELLEDFESEVEKDPKLLQLLMEIQIKNGEREEVLARMDKLFSLDGELPVSFFINFLELAMEGSGDSTAPGLGNSKAETTLIKKLLEKFGDQIFSGRPLLAAEIMVRLNNEPAAVRWIKIASARNDLTLEQRVDLVALYSRLPHSRGKGALSIDNKLKDQILAELKSPGLPGSRREELVYALLDLKAYKSALPHLRTLANNRGGDWVAAYEESLQKLGRQRELVKFWVERVNRADLPVDSKRELAYQILETHHKSAAVAVFKKLAQTAPPESPDVKQLMYLWGPRPGPEVLKWLVSRCESSVGDARAAWLQHLILAGGARQAIDIMGKAELSSPPGDSVFQTYLLAWEELRDGPAFANAVRERVKTENDPDRLSRYAKLAVDLEQYEVARAAYQKYIKMRPKDVKVLREMGIMAFNANRRQEARVYFEQYLKRKEHDWQANYNYAESLLKEEGEARAETFYQRALDQIEKNPKPTQPMQIARANILTRLGRKREAAASYENLMKKYPGHPEIRGQFLYALMEWGDLEKAQRLLLSSQGISSSQRPSSNMQSKL
ncbi:MAG: tetratricopeptide repeat protein [Nitrospinaceae bacterium]